MPPRAHSILSPSSVERWINCPPSAVDNAAVPRTDTVFTLEGTLAHEMAEVKARIRFGECTGEEMEGKLAELRANELYDPEMDVHTDRYVDCLQELYDEFEDAPSIHFEQRLDLRRWMEDGFGTADCVMVGMNDIHVVDFKYGKGLQVSPDHNPQMMIYALGAVARYSGLLDQENVHMTIVQPRIAYDPSTCTVSMEELMNWAELTLKPAASLAAAGKGERKPGDWCRWCCNSGNCNAQLAEFESMPVETEPCALTPEQVVKALELAPMLDKWFEAVKEHALKECMEGDGISGWKAVEGRSIRDWRDRGEAFKAAVASGIPEDMLYERKPLSVAALEKVMGKKAFADTVGGYVEKTPGKPTLAKESDKREAITKKASAADDFE